MGNTINKKNKLTPFQQHKLLHDFATFFDLNKNGVVDKEDFRLAREQICKLNGWTSDNPRYRRMEAVFNGIWDSLVAEGDEDNDDSISSDEWLKLWTGYLVRLAEISKDKKLSQDEIIDQYLPVWWSEYVQFRFELYDRTGDGVIDVDEFCFVLSNYGVPEKEARQAWLIMTENDEYRMSFGYFYKLTQDYYISANIADVGTFITGKIDFTDTAEKR